MNITIITFLWEVLPYIKVNVTKKSPNLGFEFGKKARKDSTTGKTANILIP